MSERPFVLALIPARAGSKGVPGKNIRALAGQPLLNYSCRCALASRWVTRTIVSTDCERIANVARAAGADVPFLRPAELAQDESPTVDLIVHALQWLERHDRSTPDVVVLLQPTAPLRLPADVDGALERLMASDADSVVSVRAVEAHFHPRWQFTIQGDRLCTFEGTALAEIPSRRQLLDQTYVRNGAVYAFRTNSFAETGSIYGKRCLAFVMPGERSVNIDTLADWKSVENYLQTSTNAHEAA